MDYKYRRLQEMDLKGRRVFVRVDFNVPLQKGESGQWEVAEAGRIEGALPTIRYIMEQGGKCILASHLGRPKGAPSPKYSLEPVARKLSEYLEKDIILTDDCIGDGARGLSQQMRPGDVMLLENLRFHPEEETNSVEFANRLLELCDAYVTDAFGSLHRAHASTSALPRLIPDRGIGFLVERELEYLQPLRENPQRPFVLVMGGAKITDKIGVLEQFFSKVDTVLIGGGMAYAFLKAKGIEIGKSLCPEDQVSVATRLLKAAEARKIQFLLPVDHLIVTSLDDAEGARVTEGAEITGSWMGVDVGPKTLQLFSDALQGAETVFWNGPLGIFERPGFAKGTNEMARLIAASHAKKLAGGGDVAAAIALSGQEAQFDFISTGGGATLEYLEGKDLPGLKALEVSSRPS